MFDQYGQPTGGYGQYSPFQDSPEPRTPGRPGRPRLSPLEQAISGSATEINLGGGQQPQPQHPGSAYLNPGHQVRVNPPAHPKSPLEPEANSDAAQFIEQWQQSHHPGDGPGPLLEAMKAQGYNVAPFMYGQTQSNNEISLDGQKYKVISGEDNPATTSWYKPGTDDSPQGKSSGSGLLGMLMGLQNLGNNTNSAPTVTVSPTTSTGQISPLQSAISRRQY